MYFGFDAFVIEAGQIWVLMAVRAADGWSFGNYFYNAIPG
jgi:hypothetical protein